jgi:hypothetical protein
LLSHRKAPQTLNINGKTVKIVTAQILSHFVSFNLIDITKQHQNSYKSMKVYCTVSSSGRERRKNLQALKSRNTVPLRPASNKILCYLLQVRGRQHKSTPGRFHSLWFISLGLVLLGIRVVGNLLLVTGVQVYIERSTASGSSASDWSFCSGKPPPSHRSPGIHREVHSLWFISLGLVLLGMRVVGNLLLVTGVQVYCP